ncbi:hypothetical protein A9Y57_00133 [Streptococcus parauberis]|uniref:Uncharacterized protein n=1 Tax=Streptococcus parauberis TaxID=1348 RepID=A0A854WB26_9STRE|nr:hypothetical protein [Streptococcus parauberis]PCH13865.1 hypothetical protein A9Y57_00499 [Streptococcus parauberis]PCH14131.1 hypothetical protein A9Y57_00133 [Streptococcus parauberis]
MDKEKFREKYEELQEEYAGVRVTMYEEYADDLDWLVRKFLEEVE